MSRSVVPAAPLGETELIGRDVLLGDVVEALRSGRHRIVTLIGAGGVGKTRLAREAANLLAPSLPGAVVYVPLSSISDPAQVLPAVVHAAGLSEQSTREPLDVLAGGLGDLEVLLVLDNLEQVVDVAPTLDSLVERCPRATVLATSRVALRLRSEHTITVDPLTIPERGAPSSLRHLATNESVALFVQTARRVDRSFQLTAANADVTAEICRRLDGLPLAIELAAARLRLLSPDTLLDLLGHRLDVLRGAGRADGQLHHRTLHATIDWSYRLLDEVDRVRFAVFGIFAGGFDLDAAQAVTDVDVYDLLDTLERLVDHHLVRAEVTSAGERRFDLLDTLRAFALEELRSSGQENDARGAHADWCVALVEAAAPELTGAGQGAALQLLDGEQDNITAAIAWLADRDDPTDERGLRLVAQMWRYWWIRGRSGEGRQLAERVLGRHTWSPSARLAAAEYATGDLAEAQGDYETARMRFERALAIRTQLDDEVGRAECWNSLGYLSRVLGDLDSAEAMHAQALAVMRAEGNLRGVAIALGGLGAVAYLRGDLEPATAFWDESTEVVRTLGDRIMLALQLGNLGMARTAQGRLDLASRAHEEALLHAREFDDVNSTLFALTNLASVLVQTGDLDRAAALLDEALTLRDPSRDTIEGVIHDTYGTLQQRRGHDAEAATRFATALDIFVGLGYTELLVESLEHLGILAAARHQWTSAIEFFAIASSRRDQIGSAPLGTDADAIEESRGAAEGALDPVDLAAATTTARGWTLDQVCGRAHHFAELLQAQPDQTAAPDPLRSIGLTAREAEVTRRLIERRTDREIADELTLSLRTVTTHVSAVLRKLGVSSRRDVRAALTARDIRL